MTFLCLINQPTRKCILLLYSIFILHFMINKSDYVSSSQTNVLLAKKNEGPTYSNELSEILSGR